MKKTLVFDAGPIISLAMNNLVWVIPALKDKFNGSFVVTEQVKSEIIDVPLNSRKFAFEALQIQKLVENGVLEVYPGAQIHDETQNLLDTLNNPFFAKNQPIQIVQAGEISSLAAACHLGSSAVVVDERTTRLIMEKPHDLLHLLSHKLGTKVSVNKKNLDLFGRSICAISIIRSAELVTCAFELGLLDSYIPKKISGIIPKQKVLESALWGIKLAGCSISEKEIGQILKLESKAF